MSIYEHWEAIHKAETAKTPYPNAEAIKKARWEDFLAAPTPTFNKLSHADLKYLVKQREEEHHLVVKAEISRMRDAYRDTEERVNQGFRSALAKKYLANPKNIREHMVWEKAWEKGHANGYSEIESHYQDLAELIN